MPACDASLLGLEHLPQHHHHHQQQQLKGWPAPLDTPPPSTLSYYCSHATTPTALWGGPADGLASAGAPQPRLPLDPEEGDLPALLSPPGSAPHSSIMTGASLQVCAKCRVCVHACECVCSCAHTGEAGARALAHARLVHALLCWSLTLMQELSVSSSAKGGVGQPHRHVGTVSCVFHVCA